MHVDTDILCVVGRNVQLLWRVIWHKHQNHRDIYPLTQQFYFCEFIIEIHVHACGCMLMRLFLTALVLLVKEQKPYCFGSYADSKFQELSVEERWSFIARLGLSEEGTRIKNRCPLP